MNNSSPEYKGLMKWMKSSGKESSRAVDYVALVSAIALVAWGLSYLCK